MFGFIDFYGSYVNTALWSSTDNQGESLDAKYSAKNLAPKTQTQMVKDCREFLKKFEAEIFEACRRNGATNHSLAGQDFWLTRNGHGAGFWDGTWEKELSQKLTKEARNYGACELYVGDDGLIYC